MRPAFVWITVAAAIAVVAIVWVTGVDVVRINTALDTASREATAIAVPAAPAPRTEPPAAGARRRLAFGPDDAGIYLDDAATTRLPRGHAELERSALRLEGLGRRAHVPVTERLALGTMLADARGTLAYAFADVSAAQARDTALARSLAEPQARAQRSVAALVDLEAGSDRSERLDRTAARRLAAATTAAAGDVARLQRAIVPAFRSILAARLATLRRDRAKVDVRALSGILAVILLAVLSYRNLRHRSELAAMRRVSDRFAGQARFRAIFDRAAVGIVVCGRDGAIVECNSAFDRMLGHEPRSFIGKKLSTYTVAEDVPATFDLWHRMIVGEISEYHFEKRYRCADGSTMWADVSVSLLSDDDDADWYAIGLIEDITERRSTQDRLLYEATHDALTGLANRALFSSRLDGVLAQASRANAAVVFIDLDHFKLVNDSLGHAAGDQLLRAVAQRLAEFAAPGDTVARFGGDEFAILFANLTFITDLARRVDQIQARVAEPLEVEGRSIYPSASMGVAPLGRRYERAEDLLRDADTAMYRAKADGRARAMIFDQAMHDGAMRRLQLTSDLRLALEGDQLRLAYQPIVRLADQRTVGYEALLRWQHPQNGLVMPDDFVPMAEENGSIVKIGRWVIDEACAHLAHVQRTDPDVTMHVNLSVQEMLHGDTPGYIAGALRRYGVAPASLIVEITENAIIESTRNSDTSLRNLREIGVGVSIDDFGVGYSSLRYLHRFPISGLKIDRSFVHGADDDLASEPIVRMLLELARTLGLDVVAEGIETESQSAMLQVLGCQLGQGHLFAQPRIEPRVMRSA